MPDGNKTMGTAKHKDNIIDFPENSNSRSTKSDMYTGASATAPSLFQPPNISFDDFDLFDGIELIDDSEKSAHGDEEMAPQDQKYLNAKFDHIDYVLTEIKDTVKEVKETVKENKEENKEFLKEIKKDNKGLKHTIIITVISVALSMVALITGIVLYTQQTAINLISAVMQALVK